MSCSGFIQLVKVAFCVMSIACCTEYAYTDIANVPLTRGDCRYVYAPIRVNEKLCFKRNLVWNEIVLTHTTHVDCDYVFGDEPPFSCWGSIPLTEDTQTVYRSYALMFGIMCGYVNYGFFTYMQSKFD